MIRDQQKTGLIFVISGPSGSGKTTLAAEVLKDKKLRKQVVKTISFTTRPKRSGEQQGRDYLFINEKGFKAKLFKKEILEKTKYLGYYYGTPRKEVEGYLKQGKNIILCLDLRGAQTMRRFYPRITRTVFVRPPSVNILHERITKRCRRTKAEEIQRRLKLATKELKNHKAYDYAIVNKELKKAVLKLTKILKQEINKAR